MKCKTVMDERFEDYKKASMFIGVSSCSGKCWREQGLTKSICQNSGWQNAVTHDMPDEVLIERYLSNPITTAIVFGGLEPFDQYEELFAFITKLRLDYECEDDVVIYTGYNKDEIEQAAMTLNVYPNIVIKFGRYIPGQKPHYDEVLGVYLASDNQYAERVS